MRTAVSIYHITDESIRSEVNTPTVITAILAEAKTIQKRTLHAQAGTLICVVSGQLQSF
jgi:hypothetical protein